ncbi:MAG: hypothetical protein HYS13_01320 [Planctomycetia bacterium]|nr:hypothetical protein [Planctomycetia bacterium]
MKADSRSLRFAICIKNTGYPASLEVRKVYRLLPDRGAAVHRLLRVIDESGEDYLYPRELFVPLKLPRAAALAVSRRHAAGD